jgi:hypothetical protein
MSATSMMDLIINEAIPDELAQRAYNTYAVWRQLAPERRICEYMIPDWDRLTRAQQQAFWRWYKVPEWGELSDWERMAFKTALYEAIKHR